MAQERLQRTLARAGFGSRRACEDLIRQERVTVNGKLATLGDKADPEHDTVAVDGSTLNLDPDSRYYAFNKPTGVVTSMSDERGRPDLRSYLPEGPRVFPVGRLDLDSEGLLVLTNDGELANRLTHPRYGIEREYLAEVDGAATDRALGALRQGVDLEDGPAKVIAVRTVDRRPDRSALRVVMAEGRKREVRRILDAVGLPVTRLVRLRIGPLRLGRLRSGEIRELDHAEVRALYRAAGL
ncbi:MAG: pseudouridine synthase [Actinomycetota bacterium]